MLMKNQPIKTNQSPAWPTTRWSQIGRLSSDGLEERSQAYNFVLNAYLPVLRRHLRYRRNINTGEVDDLLQEFLLSKIVKKEILQLARKERGRFRTFLATALDRFTFNYIRDQNTLKKAVVRSKPLKPEDAVFDSRGMLDIFDAAWGRQVLGQSIRLMRSECINRKRRDLWIVFRRRLLGPILNDGTPASLSQVVEELGLKSKRQVSNLLLTANGVFGRCVKWRNWRKYRSAK
jgi:hypothetical protein